MTENLFNKVNRRTFTDAKQGVCYNAGRAIGASLVESGYARASDLVAWALLSAGTPAAGKQRLAQLEADGTQEEETALLTAALEAQGQGARALRAFGDGARDGVGSNRLASPEYGAKIEAKATAEATRKAEIEEEAEANAARRAGLEAARLERARKQKADAADPKKIKKREEADAKLREIKEKARAAG